MVEDALSKKAISIDSFALLLAEERPLAFKIQSLDKHLVRLEIFKHERVLDSVDVHSRLLEYIKAQQFEDKNLS